MKAVFNIVIASALLAAAYAQAPEGEAKKRPPHDERPPHDGPSREEIIKKFDKDGDGKLNDEEEAAARAAMQAKRAGMEGKYKEMLAKFDKDGDGKLSEDERKAMKKEMLAKFDKDGDGELNEQERKAMREAMGEHRPHKPRAAGPKEVE